MTKIMPNIGKEFCENPPYIANCKCCGAEAVIKGEPDWEWWTYSIQCSAYCKDVYKTRVTNPYNIKELIAEWNRRNEVQQ